MRSVLLKNGLQALQPLRNAVTCELFIADTGSTDGTRELAMQYADVLFDFEWVNDFSAARNAVMDRCSGKWYLTVDADEYLDPNISEFLRLLSGENDLPLPDGFFARSTDRLTSLADELGDLFKDKFPRVLMDRTAQDGNDDNPKVVIWNHALLFSALTAADWTSDDAETLHWLIDTYAMLSSAVLNFYYKLEALCEETVALLPDNHHFGWFFLQGLAAKEEGDALAYIRCLRKALKAAPVLKEMVEYLQDDVKAELEQTEKERKNAAVNPELLDVAAQIRTVLAQYAPDDPVVAELKKTPAYQAVAHLIEGAV